MSDDNSDVKPLANRFLRGKKQQPTLRLPFRTTNFKSLDPEVNKIAKEKHISIDKARDIEIQALTDDIKKLEKPVKTNL